MGRLQKLFSQQQIDLIIGSLLGDARLECRSKGIHYPVSARLRIHQSDKQKEYVFWKYSLLRSFVLKEPRRVKTWHDLKRDKDHYSWYFHTKTIPELGEAYHYFYKNNVKVLPKKDIFNHLTPRALAVWFMDDGSNVKNGYTISTHCFDLEDQRRIVNFLKTSYGIGVRIIKDRDKFKLFIGKGEYEKFSEIVGSYIIPSMQYKLCSSRNDLSGLIPGRVRKLILLSS